MKKSSRKLKGNYKVTNIQQATKNVKDLPIKLNDDTVPGGFPSLDCNDQNIGVAQTPTPDGNTALQVANVQYVLDNTGGNATEIVNNFSVGAPIIYQFPVETALDAGINWDASNEQPKFFNASGTDSINFNVFAWWWISGNPIATYESLTNNTIGAGQDRYFTTTGNIIPGLDLSTSTNGVTYFIRAASSITGKVGVLKCHSQRTNDGGTIFYTTLGTFGSL